MMCRVLRFKQHMHSLCLQQFISWDGCSPKVAKKFVSGGMYHGDEVVCSSYFRHTERNCLVFIRTEVVQPSREPGLPKMKWLFVWQKAGQWLG